MISRYDAQDDGPLFTDIPKSHVFSNFVYVVWLLTHRDRGNTRQIYDSKIGAGFSEDVENDRSVDDLLLLAADSVSDCLDGGSDFVEVGKSFFEALLYNLLELSVGFS